MRQCAKIHPDMTDDVRLALRGLSHRMEVEVDVGRAYRGGPSRPSHLAARFAIDCSRRA